jgi:hypothetical protein
MRVLRLVGVVAVSLVWLSSPASAQADTAFPLSISAVTPVGEEEDFGTIIAAKVGANGTVYVVDHTNATVRAFSPEGRLLWKTGRKGRGPGEFELPYRIEVAPTGEILVYDFGTGEVTSLSDAGRFLRRARLPFSFRQVDNLVVLRNGDLIVSGYTVSNDRATSHALHRFRMLGDQWQYVGSFAPLPPVRDREVLPHWGPGTISRARNGDILYLLRLPYEIHRYDPAGRERSVFRPRVPLRAMPDDFVRIEHTARGTEISSAQPDLEHPGSMTELGSGWIVASRIGRQSTRWDLFSPSGQVVGSRAIPDGWGALLGYDSARSILWLAGEHDGAPVLLQVRVSTTQPTRNSRRP